MCVLLPVGSNISVDTSSFVVRFLNSAAAFSAEEPETVCLFIWFAIMMGHQGQIWTADFMENHISKNLNHAKLKVIC